MMAETPEVMTEANPLIKVCYLQFFLCLLKLSYFALKDIQMDVATAQYLKTTISTQLPTDKVIVTGLYNEVYEIIKESSYYDGKGILITGPPGTGKSTTCVYLHEALKGINIPFVIFPTASLQAENKSMLQDYLREQGN
jgi:DNA-binding NtrC family response regulator